MWTTITVIYILAILVSYMMYKVCDKHNAKITGNIDYVWTESFRARAIAVSIFMPWLIIIVAIIYFFLEVVRPKIIKNFKSDKPAKW